VAYGETGGRRQEVRRVWSEIEAALGGRLVRGELMSRHTTARAGGLADLFIEATSADDLRDIILLARQWHVPYFVLGGGSNILVSDAGIRGLVILNKARQIKYPIPNIQYQRVQAESGVILPTLARECTERGLAGLEWAIGVPGTVGGAVVGNAGAHGSDIAHSLVSAAVLDAEDNVKDWSAQELQFGYRTSRLKSRHSPRVREISNLKSAINNPVVLEAEFELRQSTREECEAKAAEFTEKRKRTQPPGASLGSMFKNPPGDYAGRLIEAAGLKGARVGNVGISPVHANFFVNLGGASATDIYSLIRLAHEQVRREFGVTLELEIELVGEW
jgi:UDP-N-acetylmuramate dehydrogenase